MPYSEILSNYSHVTFIAKHSLSPQMPIPVTQGTRIGYPVTTLYLLEKVSGKRVWPHMLAAESLSAVTLTS